jgi:F-type H+-transporting ATPase subunit delta
VADEPIVSGMAGRYATALFDLARDEKKLDAVKSDLDGFAKLLEDNADLLRLVRSPVFGAEEKERALAAILDKAKVGGLARNFLLLVTQKQRLFAISQIIRAFNAMVARQKGEVAAEVTVAEPLKNEHLDALTAAIAQSAGKNVQLDVKVDPSIIGGLKVKLGSRMVDASIKTKLNSIRIAMKEAR